MHKIALMLGRLRYFAESATPSRYAGGSSLLSAFSRYSFEGSQAFDVGVELKLIRYYECKRVRRENNNQRFFMNEPSRGDGSCDKPSEIDELLCAGGRLLKPSRYLTEINELLVVTERL